MSIKAHDEIKNTPHVCHIRGANVPLLNLFVQELELGQFFNLDSFPFCFGVILAVFHSIVIAAGQEKQIASDDQNKSWENIQRYKLSEKSNENQAKVQPDSFLI